VSGSLMSLPRTSRDPEHDPEIDTAGWLFSAIAVAIIAAATMVAYKAHDTTVANAPVPIFAAIRRLVALSLFDGFQFAPAHPQPNC